MPTDLDQAEQDFQQAELHLLSSLQKLHPDPTAPFPRTDTLATSTATTLANLYTTWQKPTEATRWRAALGVSAPQATQPIDIATAD